MHGTPPPRAMHSVPPPRAPPPSLPVQHPSCTSPTGEGVTTHVTGRRAAPTYVDPGAGIPRPGCPPRSRSQQAPAEGACASLRRQYRTDAARYTTQRAAASQHATHAAAGPQLPGAGRAAPVVRHGGARTRSRCRPNAAARQFSDVPTQQLPAQPSALGLRSQLSAQLQQVRRLLQRSAHIHGHVHTQNARPQLSSASAKLMTAPSQFGAAAKTTKPVRLKDAPAGAHAHTMVQLYWDFRAYNFRIFCRPHYSYCREHH
eukprot:354050-Chlamydomonas_euryale.AAC.1